MRKVVNEKEKLFSVTLSGTRKVFLVHFFCIFSMQISLTTIRKYDILLKY